MYKMKYTVAYVYTEPMDTVPTLSNERRLLPIRSDTGDDEAPGTNQAKGWSKRRRKDQRDKDVKRRRLS